MKRIIFLGILILVAGASRAQIAVVAPSLEMQEALNHAEQIQHMAQTYQTMVNVRDGISKGIDAVEKVNRKLTTIREVQEIATRSERCIRRIQRVYEKISVLELEPRYMTSLLQMCTSTTRDCINVTAYGAKVFSDDFLKLSDSERLAETRKMLNDIDKLLARVNYIDTQAKSIEFNQKMINAYIQ